MKLFKRLMERVGVLKKKEAGKKDFEWESVQAVAKEQFLKLREKGLSIPVMTL